MDDNQFERMATDFFLVDALAGARRRVVRIRRTTRPFCSAEDVDRARADMQRILRSIDRKRTGLLCDFRVIPSAHGPRLEQGLNLAAPPDGFDRVALVRDTPGSSEHAEDEQQLRTFDDAHEALRWLAF